MTERVSLRVDEREFAHWSEVEIKTSIDSFSTVTFSAPFDPEHAEIREVFRPFTFKDLTCYTGDELDFTGTMVGVDPESESEKSTVTATAYALPGVLGDCNALPSSVPLEFHKVGLKALATTLAKQFSIDVDFRGDQGAVFDKTRLEVDTKIMELLIKLGKDRNLVWSNTPRGDLLCWRSVSVGDPVATFTDSQQPITKIKANFSPQDYFSEVTGWPSTKRGRTGGKATVQNPWLAKLRPMNFKLDNNEKADAHEATRAKLGRMFANMAAFTVGPIPTWRDPQGNLWRENTTVVVTAPKAMIYRPTELLIRTVTRNQDANSETATLECCLPGAFSGDIPDQLPWNE